MWDCQGRGCWDINFVNMVFSCYRYWLSIDISLEQGNTCEEFLLFIFLAWRRKCLSWIWCDTSLLKILGLSSLWIVKSKLLNFIWRLHHYWFLNIICDSLLSVCAAMHMQMWTMGISIYIFCESEMWWVVQGVEETENITRCKVQKEAKQYNKGKRIKGQKK